MPVIQAKSAGFCYGVRRAVELAEKTARENGGCVMLGSIIHNAAVVQELEALGARTVDDVSQIQPGETVTIHMAWIVNEDELEYLLDISGRTPYWICRQLFCDAVFSNYLETAKDVGATMPSLMFIAEHWQDIAKPFVEAQLPGYDTYVMGGHLMFYEYPEKWNRVLEDFLNKL